MIHHHMIRSILVGIALLFVFGCGEKDKKEKEEAPPRVVYVLPAPRLPKYRVPVTDPEFGKPYNYDRAVSGNIASLPGCRLVRNGILVDLSSRRVLWEKDSRTPTPIASLTKLMTIYLVMELLEKADKPDLDSLVTVSRESCNTAPVKANLQPGEKIPLRDLLGALMLRSANDAAHQIAEFFGDGNADNFIRQMNTAAHQAGASTAYFVNPNGLPIYRKGAETQMNLCSAHDLVLISERAMEFPLVLELTSARSVVFRRGQTFNNTNHLLTSSQGADGLKTGYTGAAGHCLAFSCERNGRRLVGVVTGFQKRPDCFEFSRQLLDWGYAQTP